jgi:hypothetical protein
MKDAAFKNLCHLVAPNRIASRGEIVGPGYKPDITVDDGGGSLLYILESEQKTDRKAFLGDLIKAELHAERTRSRPTLVIVMEERSNTTVPQIADHLRPYVCWLRDLKGGTLCLNRMHVLTAQDYLASIDRGDALGSPAFWHRGREVT